MMEILPNASDAAKFGGKAATLSRIWNLLRGRDFIRIPRGVAIDVRTEEFDEALCDRIASAVPGPFAVRSSAVGEDGEEATFAGQYLSLLNVSRAGLPDALRRVKDSAAAESVLRYRERRKLSGEPRMGILVQTFIPSGASGVLFTRNPSTGADEFLIEAAWGLGEAVVGGLVTPERYRTTPAGDLIEFRPGLLDKAVFPDTEGVREVPLQTLGCRVLESGGLQELSQLAVRVRNEVFSGREVDLEWGFSNGDLYLFQARPAK